MTIADKGLLEGGCTIVSSAVEGAMEQTERAPVVRIFRTIRALEELRGVWDQWCQEPDADFDYYLVLAQYRQNFVRPHVMALYREGRLDCLLVGWLESRRIKLRVGYTTLFEPQIKQLFFVQGGLLGNASPANCRRLARELKQCLKRREADAVEFTRLANESNLRKASLLEFGIFTHGHFTPVHEHRWLELPGTFAEFLQNLSRKNRHELRRHEKRVAEDYPKQTHIHCYRNEEEVSQLAKEVEKISAKTYQRALGVGFQLNPEVMESLRISAHKGGMRGCVLYLGDQPSAFFIGKQYKDTFHGNFMGFDPQFAKYSPGLLVLLHSIEECFETSTRASRFDLGWGDRQYKRVLCNHSRQDGPMYLYSRSLRGLRLNFLRSTTSLLDLAARRALAKSSFLSRAKKLWQRGLVGSTRSSREAVSSEARKCDEIAI